MDVTTALTLVVPCELHTEINSIRSQYDRAYPRWLPHINFLFPFVPEDQFDSIAARLEPVLKSFGSFELELSELGSFKQGKGLTVHIKPKDSTRLKELFELIRKTLPEIQSKHDEFNPHLTIAQFKKAEFEAKKPELEAWLSKNNFKFTVDHICILERSKTDNNVPFSVNRPVMLC